MKQIHHAQQMCKKATIRIAKKHPILGSAALLLAVPVLMLAGISTLTAAVSVPMAMLLGWL